MRADREASDRLLEDRGCLLEPSGQCVGRKRLDRGQRADGRHGFLVRGHKVGEERVVHILGSRRKQVLVDELEARPGGVQVRPPAILKTVRKDQG